MLLILARIAECNKQIRTTHTRYTSKIKSCATLLPRLLSGQRAMTSTPYANSMFRTRYRPTLTKEHYVTQSSHFLEARRLTRPKVTAAHG